MKINRAPWNIKNRLKARLLYHTLYLIGAVCLFSIIVLSVKPFDSVNLWLSDQLFVSEPLSSNIVVVGIDDNTLVNFGKWSEWPRRLHGEAIDNLSQAGARVIGYDVLFVDDSAEDQILATSMANAGNVVMAAAGVNRLPEAEPQLSYSSFLLPAAPLELISKNIGHVNIEPDHDGKVRKLPLIVRDDTGNIQPAFCLAVLYTHFSMPLPEEYPLRDQQLFLLARDVPVDKSSQLRINYTTDPGSRAFISYGDIINDTFDHSLVKNKIVLIGMTATGEFDTWPVPVATAKIPGIFIHASAIDTILKQRFLIESGSGISLMALLLLTGIMALALPRLKLRWGVTLSAVLFIAYLGVAFLSFDKGYIIDMLYPLVLLPTILMVSIIFMIAMAQSDKQFVKDIFGRYVSSQVAKEILNSADTGQLKLGGESRDVTVLFADIRNYTVISERMSPEAIVEMLNKHLGIIIDKVLENKGMVNKFAGDNIMAVWNAPDPQPEHARLAVKAALESQQAFALLPREDATLPEVQFGIGINTGTALAGSVGSMGRAEYTVIGDTVNLASRICSSTPGGEVIIGPETYQQAKHHLEVEELEPQAFKGKAEKVTVYRVTGYKQ